ncbi:hypothetical protein J14TS5_20930 [Paenibacillus lautus]|nr:hypothetical protein J14TS5_20930 [Paenibacillus lautus]
MEGYSMNEWLATLLKEVNGKERWFIDEENRLDMDLSNPLSLRLQWSSGKQRRNGNERSDSGARRKYERKCGFKRTCEARVLDFLSEQLHADGCEEV